jgi:hypothetical protein
MSFDIVKQDYSKSAEAGYSFDLLLPDGTDADAKLTILGDLSPTVQNFVKKKYKEMKAQMDAAKRRNKEWDPTLEEIEQDAVEGALVRLIGWDGITESGKKVEFSKDKAREILTQHPWIREQIYDESKNVLNFTPNLSKK